MAQRPHSLKLLKLGTGLVPAKLSSNRPVDSDDENMENWQRQCRNALFCQADEFRGKPWSRPGEFFLIPSEALIFLSLFFGRSEGAESFSAFNTCYKARAELGILLKFQ